MTELPPPLPTHVLGPLTYATPAYQFRPGYLTALAIVSIVIGSISALSNVFGAVAAVMMMFARSSFTSTAFVTTTTTIATPPGATTIPTTAPSTMPAVIPMPMFAAGPQLLSASLALLSLAAAVVLIAGGIQLLRDRPIARLLHRLFVWIKIPLSMAAMGATAWVYSSMMSTMWTTPGFGPGSTRSPPWLFILPALTTGLVSLAYPIALLIVLSRARTRTYFDALRASVVAAQL